MIRENPQLVDFVIIPLNESCLSLALLRKEINYSVLELLIKNNINLNIFITPDKINPLEFACKTRNFNLCNYLMENGAKITSLTPHYLLCYSNNISYLNMDELQTLYKIIKLFGGLEKISNTKDGENVSFKEKASHCRAINIFGGSVHYNLWNLLKYYEELEVEKEIQPKAFKNIMSENLINPLSDIVISYYFKSSEFELNNKINIIKNSFNNNLKLDEHRIGPTYAFFKMGEKIIPERKVTRSNEHTDAKLYR